MLILVNIRSCA